jgi:hypothetical protein
LILVASLVLAIGLATPAAAVADSPPAAPNSLTEIPGYSDQWSAPCRTGASRPVMGDWADLELGLEAYGSDPDGDLVSMTFEVWNLARTQLLWSYTSTGASHAFQHAYPPAHTGETDGGIAWRAIAGDGTRTSDPSGWCEVAIDNTQPAPPTIQSADFGTVQQPAGRVDLPGAVTMSGGGRSTVAYLYGAPNVWLGSCSRVDQPVICTDGGAPVSITMVAPYRVFPFCAIAVGAGGRLSEQTCTVFGVRPHPLPAPAHRWTTSGTTPSTRIKDTGAKPHTGLVLHGARWTTDGPSGIGGPSLDFDQLPATAATGAPVIDESRSFTVSLFFRPLAAQELGRIVYAGHLKINFGRGGTVHACLDGHCAAYWYYTSGGWGHLAVTWDGPLRRLIWYLNGIPQAANVHATAVDGSYALQLGGTAYPLAGRINNVAVYNSVLTPGQIEEIAHP